MTIYDELVARGLIAQVTDEKEIKELINNGKATFYIGFDPTADSLHVGHFMALCLMKRLQMAGNKPIVLIGGGTAQIGDPSGRTDMRQMMTTETINHNVECFKKQMSRFIDFGEGKAIMVNNADWLMDLNYVDVLREVGAHFSVNRMLTAECYCFTLQRPPCFKIFPVFWKILEALISLTFQNRLCQGLANLLPLLYLKSSTIYQLIYSISNSHLVNFGMDIIYLPSMVLK